MVSKTDHLQREYPFIKDHIELLDQTSSWCLLESDSQSFHHAAQEIDLVSIMKASTSISEEIVYSNLLEKLMTIVIENAGATRGCLLMIHNEQLFIEAEITDVSENESVNIESIPINKRSDLPIQLINYVKRTNKDILLKYAANEGDFTTDPYIRTAKIQSLMCMPILHHGKLTGLLYLENNQMTAAFTEKHVQILKMIASQAAISIENARFYNELEDRVKERTRALSQAIDALRARANELTMLNKMSDMLNECRQESDTHEVLQQVCESLFPNDLGYIAIQSENQSSLEIIVQWNTVKGFDPSQIADCLSFKSAMKKRISGKAINNLCCQLQTEKMTEAVCIPLILQDKAIGIFHLQFLQTSGNHEEDELQRLIQAREELAVRMAEQYTLSLVNLRLQKKLHMESIIDPLTKLFNRRYLEESLEREGNRCKRRGKNLGLIMLDIDHFKSFNDHYGHRVGDDVLCELGKFLKGTVRKEDIACRYGGEEFILILPESSIETTAVRAQDICQKIRQQIKIVYGDEILTITASLGVAALDEHGPDIPEVIRSADEALYQAKKTGRNQVCVAKYS
ncbi:MAG: diguanylate cyclase [Candidatus Magnetoglobus multicellularis str. Araruama]|uniref:diguanylate cyclase n=1 Tax=Candidatus Magnetoglobus multicellularis str. Araruama TaxID=890399 RepID=A0A1V1P7V9_9BACT|nr:MAG: diguanylate cyclase [Candidatus Magnetoglobus multicellularis str. Araruama]